MKINKRRLEYQLDKCSERTNQSDFLQLSVYEELGFERYYTLLDNDNSSFATISDDDFVYTLSIDYSKKHKTILIIISIDDISYPVVKITKYKYHK